MEKLKRKRGEPSVPLVAENSDLLLSLMIHHAPKIALLLRQLCKSVKQKCDEWVATIFQPFVATKCRNSIINQNSPLRLYESEQYIENNFGKPLFRFVIFDIIQTLCMENKLIPQKCVLLLNFACSVFSNLKSFYLKRSNAIIYILMFEKTFINRNVPKMLQLKATETLILPFNPYDEFIVVFTNILHRACFSQTSQLNKQNWNEIFAIISKLFETYNDQISLSFEDSLIFQKYHLV